MLQKIQEGQIKILSECDAMEIKIIEEGKNFWRIHITALPHKTEYEVITQRHEVRIWKKLETAVKFVKETCPNVKNLSLTLK